MLSIKKIIKGSFPLTILNAEKRDAIKQKPFVGIKTTSYKSLNVNQQFFFKPISKI